MNIYIVCALTLYYFLDAACDAIDHAKGGRRLEELWHILKACKNVIVIFSLSLLYTDDLYVAALCTLSVGVSYGYIFAFVYRWFRLLNIDRWDDFGWTWLHHLWRF